MSRFHALKIADVRKETAKAVSIAFHIPEELRDAFAFKPGQYLTLKADIDGEAVQRSYSICSGLDDGELRVAIKAVEGGKFSSFANDNLSAGMTLEVMAPDGRFTAEPDSQVEHDYAAFASGSGVTPILSIVKSILEREPKSRFTFFYGNRDTGSIIFRELLSDLKDRYMDRFNLIHVLSREAQEMDILHGRLDETHIRKLANRAMFDAAKVDAIFLCGPGDMIEKATDTLVELGAARDKIRFEMFAPADGSTPRPASEAAQAAAKEGVEVTAVLDGTNRNFEVEEDDDNLIDAAHRHGVELPFSCKGGMCCTCRCKVSEGEVEMAVNYSLEPWEVEAGFVLACQSRPLTKKVTLDFDEA